jgi:hypothetical protein
VRKLVPAALLIFLALAGLAPGVPARAAVPAGVEPSELARIERLIGVVAQSADRRFIRNGTDYDAATAARFLRLKWQTFPQRVHTAEDFIREIGSQSGTSGSRYRVRAPDGSEEDSATFLTRLLTQGAPAKAN